MAAYRVFKVYRDGTDKRIATKRSLENAITWALMFAMHANHRQDRGIICMEVRFEGKAVRRIRANRYMSPEELAETTKRLESLPPFLLEWKKKRAKERWREMCEHDLSMEVAHETTL